MTRVHSFTDDALGDLDAIGLVGELADGRVSIPEVVEAAIRRTEAVNPALNAVAHADYDGAILQARNPHSGCFAGVPSFLKDNVDVKGMPTGHGADAFDLRPAPCDGDFASMFRTMGFIPLGKTRMSEFGWSASAEHPRLGPVRSPWDTRRTAGASSSGSAALVAAGAVPLAHGNDGGGSIRTPAAVNGLVGLKPTRGRLAQDRFLRTMPVRIVSDGVLTRTVRDTAAFFRESETVFRNPNLAPIGSIIRPGKRRLRIGFATDGIGRRASPEIRRLTLQTAALLESLGHRVEEVRPPAADSFAEDFLLYWAFLAMVVTSTGRHSFGPTWDASRLDSLTLGLARHCRRNLHRLPLAILRLRRSGQLTARFYATFDVLLTPTVATETPPIGHLDPANGYARTMDRLLDWIAYEPLQNATGEPAISLPLATTASGMPVGMMFAGPVGGEASLLELAYELEQARPFATIQDSTGVAGVSD
jgi:amidase